MSEMPPLAPPPAANGNGNGHGRPRPSGGYDRVPPHSLEAEVSVLGAALLSRNAASDVIELVKPEDFYRSAHRVVFEGIRALMIGNEPVDAVTLVDWLTRHDRLDEVGGATAIHDLTAAVPTAANATHYAKIVRERALMRRLIDAGTKVAQLGYEATGDAAETVDRAEALIYEIAETGSTSDYSQLKDLLNESFEQIEKLAENRSEVTGLATGFNDLDRLTAGLQPQNLVIVAARPAMGKCLAGDTRVVDGRTGAVHRIEDLVERGRAGKTVNTLSVTGAGEITTTAPSEFHANGVRTTYTLRTRLGRRLRATANHPFLTPSGWAELADLAPGDLVGLPRRLDVFGTDRMADAEVKILGHLLGHGGLRGPALSVSTASAAVDEELRTVAPALAASVARTDGVGSAWTLSFQLAHDRATQSAHLREWLQELGLWGAGAADTFVPEPVFRLPREQVATFLSRLFATGGSAWVAEDQGDVGIRYASVSERLVADVAHLLLRFGVISRVQERPVGAAGARRRTFELEIRDADDVLRFLDEIGIFAEDDACARVRDAAGRRTASHTTLPAGADSDLYWDRVTDVELHGDEPVYDLTVDELHNFVANDVVVHNSSLSLGIAQYVAVETHRPVLVFSLEMSKLEIVNRLLASEARIDSQRIKTGRLEDADWRKLGDALGKLSDAPLFIDDTPSISLMEIRSKARRLKQRQGLDLIIVDYLQLMQSHRRVDSRQQEVAEISRGMKMLAKELDIPVIALSQLSRQPESRTDKRPQLADLRESGCLTRSTRLFRADSGAPITFGELIDNDLRDVPVWASDERGRLVAARLTHAFRSGVKPVYRVRLASGAVVDATANHPFLTVDGWVALGDLAPGSRVARARALPSPRDPRPMDPDEIILLAHLLGEGTILARQPVHYTSADAANLDAVSAAAHRRFGISSRRDADGRSARTTQLYLPAPYHLTHGRRNPIAAWLDELGVWDRRAPEKRIPGRVFELPDEQVRLFVHHLWATDGCVHVRGATASGPRVRCYYATSSAALATDLQLLLLRLGLHARVREVPQPSGRPGYHVTLNGVEQQRRFLSEVGVHGDRGRLVSAAIDALDGVVSNPNVDVIPREIWSRVRQLRSAKGMSEREFQAAIGTAYCGTGLYRSGLSRQRMGRVAGVLDADDLRALADNDLLWDEIVAIEPQGEQPVYDATVADVHNFVAEGFLLHNSIEQDADIVGFIYRDEVYDEDSPDKGIAELIVSKHRNGATGIVKLAFLNHLTKFANLAHGGPSRRGGGPPAPPGPGGPPGGMPPPGARSPI